MHLYENNVGIDYQYFRPLDANETPEPASCTWVSSNWTDCSTGWWIRVEICGEKVQRFFSASFLVVSFLAVVSGH